MLLRIPHDSVEFDIAKLDIASGTPLLLLCHDEVPAAILLPALLGAFRAERPLFAPAYRVDPVGRNTERDEIVLRRLRAALAEAQVIFRRAALVAVALDRHMYR